MIDFRKKSKESKTNLGKRLLGDQIIRKPLKLTRNVILDSGKLVGKVATLGRYFKGDFKDFKKYDQLV